MIKIKKYNDKYRKEVNSLLYKILIEEYGFNEFKNGLLEKDYKIFKKMKNRLWIAIDTETNRLIGTTGFVCLNKKEALLKLVYVDKESRGTGIAQDLMNYCLDYLNRKRYEKVFLETYHRLGRAKRFYAKNDFVECGQKFGNTIGDEICFVLNLKENQEEMQIAEAII